MVDMKKRYAFTLVEMLVVIAIIGIIAALVINMDGPAKARQRQVQVESTKQKLLIAIDNYQSKLNYYPPDNTNLLGSTIGPNGTYDGLAATNSLLYELTGATNYMAAGTIQLFDGTNVQTNVFFTTYGRLAVNNAYQDAPPQIFLQPRAGEYTNYYQGSPLKGLLVPVPLAYPNNMNNNFWHYDASTTNRHNMTSYDLWAEYAAPTSGSNITIGNW